MDRWMDRRGPVLCGQRESLPSQEACAAAELDEKLPFTESVRLHHLAEGLVSWGKEEKSQTLDTVKTELFHICWAPIAHQAEDMQSPLPAICLPERWHLVYRVSW